jgi:hypothetical protein
MLDPTSAKSILGAAAARARMCRALNLISAETHKLLKKFLIFRNEHFGHSRAAAKLTDEKINKDLIRLRKLAPPGFEDFFSEHQGAKGIYMTIVVILFALLGPANQPDQSESQPSSS